MNGIQYERLAVFGALKSLLGIQEPRIATLTIVTHMKIMLGRFELFCLHFRSMVRKIYHYLVK